MDPNSEHVAGRAAWLVTQRNAILFGALVLRLITAPAVESVTDFGWFPATAIAKALQWLLLIFACVLAIGRGRTLAVLVVAVFAALVLEGIDVLWQGQTVTEAGKAIFACVLLTWAIVHLLRRTFLAQVVRSSNLHAAAAIYLLLGFAFANAYQLLHLLHPGAFHFPEGTGIGEDVFLYFSFITLATVGYGDVTPVSGMARMLAVTEAVAGQVYLVVSVSRLVGLYVAHRTSRVGD